MFVAWYLSKTAPGGENLLKMGLLVVGLYLLCTLLYRQGRTLRGLKRAAVGALAAEAMWEFGWYLAYMEYFPGYDALGEPLRIMPGFVLCPLFFIGAWWLVKIINNMLG